MNTRLNRRTITVYKVVTVPFQSLSARPKDKHNGCLHIGLFQGSSRAPGTRPHVKQREGAELAEREATTESFVSLLPLPPLVTERRRVSCDETQCKINK